MDKVKQIINLINNIATEENIMPEEVIIALKNIMLNMASNNEIQSSPRAGVGPPQAGPS